ncbi:MAG: gliding motility-associated C-terminal domain-containing protein [Chitinophagaceae bacterium]|nr:MAG: fibronectin type III domain-containing protein [Bacteroidetes bacterium OLB11]MCC6448051.1 gliding motility-associated C-terminal domain-containing protein [Chitinophagaceae bacterium]
MKYKILFLFFLLLHLHFLSTSQCAITINSFPYNEDFEATNGNWVNGGVLDDWAWGSPSKSIIQNAGGGAKCWIVGGLSGNFYNYNERSYILSPCFDFTNLTHPFVKFKIYWETENVYDGATFQYSLNNGATWVNVGAYNESYDCLNQNWFNQNYINALNTLASPQQGWAGTSLPTAGSCNGGAGSMGWLTAQHTLQNLAGQPNVQFRFAFGAGSICNNFNGFAMDDFMIANAVPISWTAVAPNNITCNGVNNGSINALASGIGPITYHLAPNNLTNFNGTFNSLYAGSYTVTATDANGCSISSSVVLIQPSPIVFNSIDTTNLNCYNDGSGVIKLNYSGGVGTLVYQVFPSGQISNNGIFTGLNGGTYTITVKDAANCSMSTSITLSAPPPIILTEPVIHHPSCNPNNDGSISFHGTGGTPPLAYSIGGPFETNPQFSNLTTGIYTIVAKDAHGCTETKTAQLINPNAPIFSLINTTNCTCFNIFDGAIQVTATSNNPILNYTMQPQNIVSGNGQFSNLQSGTYTITVSDVNSCTSSTLITIIAPDDIKIISVDKSLRPCNEGAYNATIVVAASGGIMPLTYSIPALNESNTNGIFKDITTKDIYTVIVSDANQCQISTKLELPDLICCDKLILPNAFSPNADSKNDYFKIINAQNIILKTFVIYNRFGGLAFQAQNINDSWDGKTHGIEAEIGTYYYMIKYICLGSGKEHTIWGDVMLVR